ncbi:helix-turn-helix transcriptional regulator [Cytobacillus horneckiae]|uniref:helix-turn-helix domain-containing protein n=1 Tax=Cytobacillus horneckiae TaxID=549687 RepID=UPI0034CDEECF
MKHDEVSTKIGLLIRNTRENKKMRAFELADLTGLSTATISNIENGKIGKRVSAMQNILSIFNVLQIDFTNDYEILEFLHSQMPPVNLENKNEDEIQKEIRRVVTTKVADQRTSPLIGEISRVFIDLRTIVYSDDLKHVNPKEIETITDIEHLAIQEAIFETFKETKVLGRIVKLSNEKIEKRKNELRKSKEDIMGDGWSEDINPNLDHS